MRETVGRARPHDPSALGQQRAELLLLAGAARKPLILVDGKRRILHLNPASEGMFGWRASHLLGRPLDVLFADPDEMWEVLLTASASPAASPTAEKRVAWPVCIVSRRGRRSTVAMSAEATTGAEGARFVVTFVPCAPSHVPGSGLEGQLVRPRVDAPPRRR